jgi:hypothetical protein
MLRGHLHDFAVDQLNPPMLEHTPIGQSVVFFASPPEWAWTGSDGSVESNHPAPRLRMDSFCVEQLSLSS